MPANTAMAFFKSVMRIPGTHVYQRMLEEVRRDKQEIDDRHEAIQAYAGAAAIGGTSAEIKVTELSPYWKDIMSGTRR